MAQTALSAKLVEAIGSFTQMACGVAGGSGTTTTVTVPQFSVVLGAGAMGATSSTAPYVDTVSANTFTVTTASADLFFWIAYGKAKV